MIEVIYIATDDYSNFYEGFIDSIKYFFPNEKKIVRVLSNVVKDYYVPEDSNVERVEFYRIFDLFYPCINLNKTYFISQLPPTEADYVFYFDADTMFFETDGNVWENLLNDMDEGKFCVGRHPYYNISDKYTYKARYIENFFEFLTTRDKTQHSYIPQYYYTYIISSFFCARRDIMDDICQQINELTREDLKRSNSYRMPLYMDENYFNKLVYEWEFEDNRRNNFSVKNYILLTNSENIHSDGESFIYQKNNKEQNKRLRH